MKAAAVLLALLAQAGASDAGAGVTPVEKALELLASLRASAVQEGVDSQKVYDEYAEWCEDNAKSLKFDVKTEKSEIEALQATIDKCSSNILALGSKVDELAGEIATATADLKKATGIREKEKADFVVEEKELADVVKMLERAVAILERDMAKSPAMLQTQLKQSGTVVQALEALVHASVFTHADLGRIQAALLQGKDQSKFHDAESDREDSDAAALGAPDSAAYTSHSSGVVEVLEDLLETAEGELDKARKAETKSQNDYEMVKQALTDDLKFDNQDLEQAKKSLTENQQLKATAEGDLAVTTKDFEEDLKTLSTLKTDCQLKAGKFEEEVKSRGEEVRALGEAQKALKDMSEGANEVAYGLVQGVPSLLQLTNVGSKHAGAPERKARADQAVAYMQDLASKTHFKEFSLLASRMSSAFKLGVVAGFDPFAKVSSLINDLIARLVKEAEAEAAHKGYCDKELSAGQASKAEKTNAIEVLSVKIDLAKSRSAKLKEEVSALQKELAEIAASQVEMDAIRAKELALYKEQKASTESGIEGVKLALHVLGDYYGTASSAQGHEKQTGKGEAVIGLLEVIESDFTQALTKIVADEEESAATHKARTQENEITRAAKSQDVKYKTAFFMKLDKAVAESSSDRASVQEELDAVLEGLEKLKVMCAPKTESYEERKARREQEIGGLKEALNILEGMAFFQQKKLGHPSLRARG